MRTSVTTDKKWPSFEICTNGSSMYMFYEGQKYLVENRDYKEKNNSYLLENKFVFLVLNKILLQHLYGVLFSVKLAAVSGLIQII